MTNRLVCSMLPGLTFIYFNQLIIDVEMSDVVHTGMEVHRMDLWNNLGFSLCAALSVCRVVATSDEGKESEWE